MTQERQIWSSNQPELSAEGEIGEEIITQQDVPTNGEMPSTSLGVHPPPPATDVLSANNLPPATPALEPAQPQLQQRLFSLTLQIDRLEAQLASVLNETQASGSQVSALTQHLTDIGMMNSVQQQLAELTTTLTDQQEQLARLTQTLTQLARQDQVLSLTRTLDQVARQDQVATLIQALKRLAQQDQVASLTQAIEQVARQDRLEQIAQSMVNREQVEQLLQVVADRQQMTSLDDTLKKLTRTQFKSNTLGENKEQQIENALTTLRDLGNRRQQVDQTVATRNIQQLAEARTESRAELAAEFLPALDSLELALENGDAVLDQQTQTMTAITRHQANYVAALDNHQLAVQQAPTPGFWQRLFKPDQPLQLESTPPDPLAAETLRGTFHETTDIMRAWLKGLELVRDRFQGLLANEGIQEIVALHQPFDPRLHVAVATEARNDITPNTVVRVARKGYRQHNRILRYAEVVVAREW